jgi:hypothetical protein
LVLSPASSDERVEQWVPIIHQPSFDPAKEPVLTLAMIVIGACYTDFEGAVAFSIALSEFTRRLLVFMVSTGHIVRGEAEILRLG